MYVSNDFYGLPTCSIGNEYLRVEFLTTAGPRIVRLFVAGSSDNLLAETPEGQWETPYGEFRLYGGHRLWRAPEVFPQTSFPDNDPVSIEELSDGVRLTQRAEAISGVAKSIELHLDAQGPALTLVHRLQNEGAQTHTFAPWGITQLPLGGVAFLPQPSANGGLGPNRHLALWPYTRWTDPRLQLSDEWIHVHASPQLPPLKIGYFNCDGWIAYAKDEALFVKRFEPQFNRPHADFDCNVEVYVNDRFIELETLGPLTCLESGQSVALTERWELYAGTVASQKASELQAMLRMAVVAD